MPTSGYSGTPLVKKLGIKSGMSIHLRHVPDHFLSLLGELPDDVKLAKSLRGPLDYIHLFVKERAKLEAEVGPCQEQLHADGMIWVSWPKKASKVATDITEDVIREVILPRGLVDIKVCAVDEVWSGLKLVIRKELRK